MHRFLRGQSVCSIYWSGFRSHPVTHSEEHTIHPRCHQRCEALNAALMVQVPNCAVPSAPKTRLVFHKLWMCRTVHMQVNMATVLVLDPFKQQDGDTAMGGRNQTLRQTNQVSTEFILHLIWVTLDCKSEASRAHHVQHESVTTQHSTALIYTGRPTVVATPN